ncbi:phosphonate metabolism transcriptional regulator PhnF [Aquabacterium sp. A7-Y]|uniref:phosphonate metabolism transcriptional regulator PhnF n=1 Tax=Aquabacterium sp. A7-Y TaxID=1349605 RepID=UPI00223D06DC|nr:phosphonate metabolism transcriptional regulator PhnF [Aquabacterium sp. A7-Y]MCW7541330.1 phosphonate metabolism transcriptional regulator PhnF [Aquabacterium sp. A7-Y]
MTRHSLLDLAPAEASAEAPRARLWEAIAQSLREDIVSGRIAPGERLPNETALAQRFGVNRHTLRQAVQALVREGHLRVVHGSGTYVRELVLDYALQRRTRLSENVAQAGERASRELLSHERVPAGAWARPLKVAASSEVEVLHTRASIRGRPVGITTSAYPCPRLAEMAAAFGKTGAITAALRRLGVDDYVRVRSTISTRLPTLAEADALARPVTQPVLVVQYVNADLDGTPVEAGTTLFAADAVQLTVEPDGDLA